MAKLNNNQVDTNQILSHPKETWSERFMRKTLSNAMVLTIFTTFIGYVKKCFAQKNDSWDVAVGKVQEGFQYSRRILIILMLFLLGISFLVALFKKAFWWQVLCTVLLIFIFVPVHILISNGFFNIDEVTGFCVLAAYICLFPCLFYYILCKCKKVTRKTAIRNIAFYIIELLLFAVFILLLVLLG